MTLAALGETVQLTATVLDEAGQAIQGAALVWASSDGSVATVDAGGVVTAVWNGSTTISAAVQGGGASGSVSVTVAQQAREIQVAPNQTHFPALRDTLRLSARAFDANGHLVETAEFTWFSTDESVVTVDATGLVTSTGNGTASVTATSGPASGTAEFSVAQEPVEVRLSPAADTLRALGDTLRMVLGGTDANGSPVERVGEGFSWSSDDESVATVDATGLATSTGNGSASITASRNGLTSSAIVTVRQVAVELRLSPLADTLRALRDTLRLSAEGFDSNEHVVADAVFTWSSADETVVTVDATGLVTAEGNGSTDVLAASGSASAGVRVSVAQLTTAIHVVPAVDTLRWLGDTLRLSADAFDTNRYSVEGTTFIWSSSDASVATVDATGLVTGEGRGSVEIMATTDDAGITGTATLVVETLPARDALVALYNATGGPNWKNSENWLTDAPLSDWYGVFTQADDDDVVTDLALRENGLDGVIPPELENLVDLEGLFLQNNELSGPIPPEIAGLAKLKRLNLLRNRLSGPIPPALGTLVNLVWMDLRNNNLTGSIPPELGNLAKLQGLSLNGNTLTGSIPVELGNLDSLELLSLGSTGLTGAIPPQLGSLDNLESLNLSGNNLTGSIPSELGRLVNLRSLSLASNDLTGPIPSELGDLTDLQHLHFGYNELTGAIPPELGSLGKLEWLLLEGNNLTGSIPRELGNLADLVWMRLDDNDLTGAIPPELGNLGKLELLLLEANGLTGAIPSELGNLGRLRSLGLAANGLTGAIPPELGNLGSLESLGLFQNNLTGTIPPELGNLGKLETLALRSNSLTGPLPRELGSLPGLTYLGVRENGLTGEIPQEYVNLKLESFWWEDTHLCAPANETFQTWLRSIRYHGGGATCSSTGGS